MPIMTININMDVDINYYEKKTDLNDQQIAELVYKSVEDIRNELAAEIKINAISILDGDIIK